MPGRGQGKAAVSGSDPRDLIACHEHIRERGARSRVWAAPRVALRTLFIATESAGLAACLPQTLVHCHGIRGSSRVSPSDNRLWPRAPGP